MCESVDHSPMGLDQTLQRLLVLACKSDLDIPYFNIHLFL